MQDKVFSAPELDKTRYRCQYLVVGTGAGGSVAGALLAEAGKDVLFLEEGDYHPTGSFSTNVGEMTARLYRNQGIFPFLGKPTMAFAESACVGGGTVINGGLIWRTPPWILGEWQQEHQLDEFNEDQLTPHFETIERDLHVTRAGDDENANLASRYLEQGARALDWKSVHVPRAVKDCINENFCATGCLNGSKQSMLLTYLPRATAKGAKIFSGCRVVRINHRGGQARSVLARVGGKRGRLIEVEFDQLILAGGAVQTPYLLRRSGLAPQAGRSLQFHMNLKVVAIFDKPVMPEKSTIFTIQVQEFEREGTLIMASNTKPHYVAMTLSHYSNDVINRVLTEFDRTSIFATMIRPKSRARIMSRLGQPFVTYKFEPEDLLQIKKALRHTVEILLECGARQLYLPVHGMEPVDSLEAFDRQIERLQPGQLELITVHVMSSCPMGKDPQTSVVDPTGKLRDLSNVTLTDASILPSNIGESPQGTIMAFAHEITGRHLA